MPKKCCIGPGESRIVMSRYARWGQAAWGGPFRGSTLNRFTGFFRSLRVFAEAVSRPDPVLPVTPLPNRPRVGVALGGGFARGMAHVGILKVLLEEGIPVDYVAGTSVGAVIGAMYCSGVSVKELEELAALVRFRDFARWTVSRFGFCSNDRMEPFFGKLLKCRTFEDLKVPLAVVATDFSTGEPVVFRSGRLVDAIRASCAYPGMFLPVEIDGRSYIDGMLAYAVPTTPLRRMGADFVLGVHLSAHWTECRAPRHLFEVIGQCFSIAQARMSDAWKKDADLVLEPDVRGFSYDCFDCAKELIAIGESSARSIVPQLRELLNMAEPIATMSPVPTVASDASQSTVVA